MTNAIDALTDKEKETLRLLLRGYDSKSIARHFNLSVHTVNERLRNARQKMAVSSSREAARLLHESEGGEKTDTPENLGDKDLGYAPITPAAINHSTPPGGHGRRMPLPMFIGVIAVMSIVLSLIALAAASPELARAPDPAPQLTGIADPAQDTEVVQAARQWLAFVDAHDWEASWAATGQQFRELNSKEQFAEIAESVQPKLGATVSRTFLSQEFVPAPPSGYEMVKFRTEFAEKPDTIESIALQHEDGQWRVVGYWLKFDGEL